jgi:ribulose-phosphate 3-epimerase
MAKVGVTILDADFGNLQSEVDKADNADFIHFDVMDGHFVDNLTFGPKVVSDIKTKLKKVVHLMIEQPERYVDRFIEAGADEIILHLESTEVLDELIERIKKRKLKVGLAVNPETKIHWLRYYFDKVDRILIMTAEPGYGGQPFMYEMLDKITEIRDECDVSIAVDCGINEETAKLCVLAGADVIVSGTFIYKNKDHTPKEAVEILKKI